MEYSSINNTTISGFSAGAYAAIQMSCFSPVITAVTGFRSHRNPVQLDLLRGPPIGSENHPFPDQSQGPLGQRNLPFQRRNHCLHGRSVECADFLDQVRLVESASIGQGRVDHRQFQGSNRYIALPDTHV